MHINYTGSSTESYSCRKTKMCQTGAMHTTLMCKMYVTRLHLIQSNRKISTSSTRMIEFWFILEPRQLRVQRQATEMQLLQVTEVQFSLLQQRTDRNQSAGKTNKSLYRDIFHIHSNISANIQAVKVKSEARWCINKVQLKI